MCSAKTAAWIQIAQDFNTNASDEYWDMSTLKDRWDNMKRKAKKNKAAVQASKKKTGGGPPEFEYACIDLIIMSIPKERGTGFPSSFDDDEDCNG